MILFPIQKNIFDSPYNNGKRDYLRVLWRVLVASAIFIICLNPVLAQSSAVDPQEKALKAELVKNFGLAWAYEKNGDYDKAIHHYSRALDIQENLPDSDKINDAKLLLVIGNLYERKGQYADAIRVYQRRLAILERVIGTDHENTADTLNKLGELYERKGGYVDALASYERGLAIYEKIRGHEHVDVAKSLADIGRLYVWMDKGAEAYLSLQGALSILENFGLAEDQRALTVINHLAMLNTHYGAYEEAIAQYQRNISVIERVRTADSTFNATTLANLSEIYRELGQFDQALPLAKRALDILEKSGSDESKRATVMNNLGLIFKSQGNYAEALRNFQQSLTLTENRLDKTHPDVAGTLSNLSALYLELNDTSTALSLAQRSLAICEQAYGSNHTTTATVINSIAVVYARLGDNKKSLELYQRSLAILVATVGEDHPRTAQVQANIAALYKGDGKLEEALAMYQKALTTYVNSLGTEHPDLISVLDNMADVYYQQHDYKNAIKVIDWAYRIGAQTASPIHWKAPLYLASLEALMGERDAAIYFGKQGINALQELRTSVAKIGTEEQKSFLSDKSWRYVGLADLLIQEGRIPEAQQVMAMLKEEEYFDFIRRDAGGDGKQLSLAELRTGGWKFDGVDMMTLSACNTAVDGAGNGREFEGFGALVQRQGAKGVLATLWPVADQSTAILMQPFYRSRQEKHLTKAEALREAQLALINGTHKLPKGLKALPAVKNAGAPNAPVFTPDPAKPYAHPYYWAPFILMGNWL